MDNLTKKNIWSNIPCLNNDCDYTYHPQARKKRLQNLDNIIGSFRKHIINRHNITPESKVLKKHIISHLGKKILKNLPTTRTLVGIKYKKIPCFKNNEGLSCLYQYKTRSKIKVCNANKCMWEHYKKKHPNQATQQEIKQLTIDYLKKEKNKNNQK